MKKENSANDAINQMQALMQEEEKNEKKRLIGGPAGSKSSTVS